MTQMREQIKIPLSKKKLILMLIGSMGFVVAGFWFVIKPPTNNNLFLGNPIVILLTGIVSILIFGFCAFSYIRKILDNKPGLIIDNIGLTDNSSGVSVGQILWNNIENISVIEIFGQKLILIKINNPQEYINKQMNCFKKKFAQINMNKYGTPLSITSNTLKIKFDELLNILNNHLNASRKHNKRINN